MINLMINFNFILNYLIYKMKKYNQIKIKSNLKYFPYYIFYILIKNIDQL